MIGHQWRDQVALQRENGSRSVGRTEIVGPVPGDLAEQVRDELETLA